MTWQYEYPMADPPTPQTLAVIVIAAGDMYPDGTPKVIDDEGLCSGVVYINWWGKEPVVRGAIIALADHARQLLESSVEQAQAEAEENGRSSEATEKGANTQ